VSLVVELAALDGEAVFGPELLVMNERALPRAVDQVLEGADGE